MSWWLLIRTVPLVITTAAMLWTSWAVAKKRLQPIPAAFGSGSTLALNNRAIALRALNRLDDALVDRNKAVELQPRDPVFRRNRANTLVEMHQYDRALSDCNFVINELQSSDRDDLATCHFLRARCREALKQDPDLALADYRAALVMRQHLPNPLMEFAVGAVARLQGLHERGIAAATVGLIVFSGLLSDHARQQSAAAASSSASSSSASSSAAASASAASLQQVPQLSSWSAQKVSEWMRSMGKAYERYAAAFVDNGITGEVMLKVLQNETQGHALFENELGISSMFHRTRIILEVQKVVKSENQQAEQKEKEEKRRERNACSICMDRERCMTFQPCGHLCACEECAKQIMAAPAGGGNNDNAANEGGMGRRCPICKQIAKETQKVFLS